MSKSCVTVAQDVIDISSESGRRKFDSEIAMMACEESTGDWNWSDPVTGDQAAWSTTGPRKLSCYHSS
jgi:hypothetical protein